MVLPQQSVPQQPIDWGLLDQQSVKIENRGERSTFGRIFFTPIFQAWLGSPENPQPPQEVDAATWAKLDPKQQGMKLKAVINVKEMNPTAPFDEYERQFNMNDKDWFNVTKPSIEGVMGKGSMSKGKYGTTLQQLQGQYVEVQDVLSDRKTKEGKDLHTMKLVRRFNNAAECQAAYTAKYGAREAGADAGTGNTGSAQAAAVAMGVAPCPPGWTPDGWAGMADDIRARKQKGETIEMIAAAYAVTPNWIVAVN